VHSQAHADRPARLKTSGESDRGCDNTPQR
jgi:hypothetical protein